MKSETEVMIRIQDPNPGVSWRETICSLVLARLIKMRTDGDLDLPDSPSSGNLLSGIPIPSDF